MNQRAAIYCRISLDAKDDAAGVARQEKDCRALAAKHDLQVIDVYTDNDLGASTRSRAKSRPAYDRLLGDARARRFDVIVAYSNSRLTRRPLDFEDLIVLHEQHGTRIKTVVSGEDDLATADGRMVARIKASVDAAEVERTSERVARKHLENARSGKPVGGTRPFGWDDDKTTVRPAEADLIRKAAIDVIGGVPLRRIVDGWNDEGVTSPRGARWSPQVVRQLLRSPRLAGWRVHRGEVARDADGEPVRGQWEPILDQATHLAVVGALTAPEGRARVPRRGGRHYLLTGLVRCGRCNALMYGNKGQKHYYYYRCHDAADGHINSASGNAVDALVTDLVLGWLEAADLSGTPAPAFDGQARLDGVKTQISELMAAFTAGALSGAVVFPAVEQLEIERDELMRQRDRVEVAAAGPDVTKIDRATWDEMDTDRRRAVVGVILDAVLIRPADRHPGNKFDHERVVPVWKGEA